MDHSRFDTWTAGVRDAAWLTRPLARLGAAMLAGFTLLWLLAWIGLSHGGLDAGSRPLGTDFLSFWTASAMALAGHATAVYDIAAHQAAEAQVFGGRYAGYYAFFYPPVYLLICLPLALLPYTLSFLAWVAATGYAYCRVARGFLAGERGWLLPTLAFPAVFCTVGHGQNAFLTTALMGGGLLLLDRRPLVAGVLFGTLVFKPHLGLLIPLFLLAGGRWRTFGAAAVSALAWVVASAVVFGPATWKAFAAVAPIARAAMEGDMIGADKMGSVFAALLLWHGGVPFAYTVQAVAALAACGLLLAVMRTRGQSGADGPALVSATLLASPFLLDYDLTLMAIPLAWTYAQARRTGFLPWEKSVLLAAFLLPLVARTIAGTLGIPLGPPVVAALLLVVVRRGLAGASTTARSRPEAEPSLARAA